MPNVRERIVFDANFYICMLAIKARNIMPNLQTAAKDLGYEYYMSEVVFDEVKGPVTFKNNIRKISKVEEVTSTDISNVKDDLGKFGIRFPAQDPDLTLIVLAKRLLDEDDSIKVHLVTDDFKLAKNASMLYKGKINILSLSSFLLKIQKTSPKSQMRKYFKNIWKRSLNYTLSYMIERSKIYPAESKITWLIEKAISVTESSVISSDIELENPESGVRFEIGAEKYFEEIEICEKYIKNIDLPSSEEELITDIINFLENLKIAREYVSRARDAIIKNESKKAVSFLKKGNGFLVSLLQLASGQLNKRKNYEIIELLICQEISKMEFLRAFLLIGLGRVNMAIDSIDRAALFSTIIHNFKTCLTLNYLKALILLFHGLYNAAIMQYNFTEELADIYEDDKLILKCGIGKAIALYIQGEDRDTAMGIMDDISNMDLEENFLDAIVVFSELGDYFLALGHSQIAANLYNQSLEISIDYKLEWKSEILIEKLKRAYIATVLEGYSSEDMVDRLDLLLDKSYSVKDVEKYNEQIKKIASFNLLFYTPFEYIKGRKTLIPYAKLPKELKEDYLEVVHFELYNEKQNQYLFIVSHYELGLLGVLAKTDDNITGIAENYTIKIKSGAKVKIYKPDEELKDSYLIRAIIEITIKNKCEIEYTLPSFFKQLNI